MPDTALPRHQDLKAAVAGDAARWELRAWSLLGVGALAIAGVFALLLALSRVPGVEGLFPWPLQFFKKGLVIHVVFSFVVWFLAVLGALAVAATYRLNQGEARGRQAGRTAVWLAAAAEILLFVPALQDATEPSLNNYVPAIIHPYYYLGLSLLFMGLAFVVLRLVVAAFRRRAALGPETLGVLMAGLIYLTALACFAFTFHLAWGEPASPDVNERLFWGGGHVLQFVNVALMAVSWMTLAGMAADREATSPRLFALAVTALAVFALIGPALYWFHEPFSPAQTEAFTNLQYLLAPTPVLLAVVLLPAIRTAPDAGDRARRLARRALMLSMAVFFLGGFLGLFVDGADTRTPAHYHGVIGGVNTALMGVFFCLLLPLMDRAVTLGRAVFALFWLYAVGQALHALGLFLAGGYGAPRKVAGDVPGLEALGAKLSLYMMGVGAVIAVVGGVMFIVIVGRALLRRPAPPDAT